MKMFFSQVWCFLNIFFHLTIVQTQAPFNLYYTDWITNSEEIFYHDCLRLEFIRETKIESESLFYCLSEFSYDFDILIDRRIQNYTFVQLRNQQITTEQLFNWLAPIDLIEDYQIYLDNNDDSLGNKQFFNCTLSSFGSRCQYQIPKEYLRYPTVYESIRALYKNINGYVSNLTCYVHVKCDRGMASLCLDWTDICNGRIDCLNNGIDEQECWQLEVNQCNEDEYRCRNGQCVPNSFITARETYDTTTEIPECIMSYTNRDETNGEVPCYGTFDEPGFRCVDRMYDYSALTSSNTPRRHMILSKILHSTSTSSYSTRCWSAFICLIEMKESSTNSSCHDALQIECPQMIFYPNTPVLYGNIYLAYNKNHSHHWISMSTSYIIYLCYKTTYYEQFFLNISKVNFNEFQCVQVADFVDPKLYLYPKRQETHNEIISRVDKILKRYHLIYNYTTEFCNQSWMYQCLNSSKCISIYRLFDNVNDCPQMDDENSIGFNRTDLMNFLDRTHFKCSSSDKYVHRSLLQNGHCNCKNDLSTSHCEDEHLDRAYIQNNILFQHICDGYTELLPIFTDGQYETDETECQYWPCNNIYTRCNSEWNCPTIEDEFACRLSVPLECSSNEHYCVSPKTYQVICLSNEKFNDSHIDCIGGTDELFCQRKVPLPLLEDSTEMNYTYHYFSCMNRTSYQCLSIDSLCNNYTDCENGDDERFCTSLGNDEILSDAKTSLHLYLFQESVSSDQHIRFRLQATANTAISSSRLSSNWDRFYCHFGFPVQYHSFKSQTKMTCFCPPSYYGSRCQYQNQRISLIVKFQAQSDSARTLFAIIIRLIDNTTEEIVHSFEQLSFLSLTDCQTKFNVYLLYSTRPKQNDREYAIHIDIYEKDVELKYRGSLLFSIQFPFLPVYRSALLVPIPPSYHNGKICSNLKCIHGRCIYYWNHPQKYTFCQCDEGWSGKYCQISHHCQCALGSLCLGKSSNNRSICVCPKNRFGSRCYLTNFICENNDNSTCLNGGQCISDGNYVMSNRKFQCRCQKGYSGDRCEMNDYKLNISFENHLIQSETYLFIHFHRIVPLTSIMNKISDIVRSTTFRTIPIEMKPIIIQRSQSFDFVFVELSKKQYFLVYLSSQVSNKTITSSDRCPNITELFNQTFVRWHLIRRIKYYHLPCQNQSLNLSCFHDESHLCICYNFYGKRLANCLSFDHNLIYNCSGRSECENDDDQCLQDHPTCPTRTMCVCKPCFYGRRCQHRTNDFGLSLDTILGYRIQPEKPLTNQSLMIKITLILTIIFVLIGFVNGLLSLITFYNKSICEVGCGLYLLGSSITTIILTILLALKFLFFLLTQMAILTNMLFIQIQCYSLDFLIRICLNLDQWLNACVATERAFTAIKGARFVKKESLKTARWIILFLCITVILSSLHDPIRRHVIVDDNENEDEYHVKRIWCITRYSSRLQIYNSVIHIIHFLGPFLFNLISSIILIIKKSRQQQHFKPNESYKLIIQEQFREHKQILIAPIVLVLLAFPRLVLTFFRTCLQTEGDAWLYLCGYFISFMPSMLTFIIFVLPSKFYKAQFRQTIQKYRQRLHIGS